MPLERWPRGPSGDPLVHLITLEGSDVGQPELAAVCVFWLRPDAPGEQELEVVAGEPARPLLLLRPGETAEVLEAPDGALVLEARSVVREKLATIEVTNGPDDRWTAAVANDDGEDFAVDGRTALAALDDAIGELHAFGVPSYTGGLPCNPSFVRSRSFFDELAARGAFLMQLEGRLFGDAGYDFCGGGWLFVHSNGVWSEQ